MTISQYFEMLPYIIAVEAFKNTPFERRTMLVGSLREAISRAFPWDFTDDGSEYWESVTNLADKYELLYKAINNY